jgi:AcrR family transcriptional regulator
MSTMTLRPLAAAIGTSDRMLIYHFGSRDELVVALLERAFDRLAAHRPVSGAASPGALLVELWAALTAPPASGAVRLYLEAAARAGQDPAWRELVRPVMHRQLAELAGWLRSAGVDEQRAPTAARLVSAVFDGLLLLQGAGGPGDGEGNRAAVDLLAQMIDDGI